MWKHPPCQAASARDSHRSNSIYVVHSLRPPDRGRTFRMPLVQDLARISPRWIEARVCHESRGQLIQALKVDPSGVQSGAPAGDMKAIVPRSRGVLRTKPEAGHPKSRDRGLT